MKTMKQLLMIAAPLFLSAVLFSGCYTQLASTHDEEENGYNNNRSYATQQETYDSTDNNNGNYYDDDYRRSCMGYFYSVPVWQTSWYYGGCVYPAWSYWDAWWWTPGWAYPAYYYYGGYHHPYYGGYGHGYGGYYAHTYSQPHGIRSGGYTRANFNGRNEFDFARQSNNVNSGGANLPSAGRVMSSSPRTSGTVSPSSRGITTQPTGTYRTSTVGRSSRNYSPSIQQPQYRNQSNGTRVQNRSSRAASGRSYNAPSNRSSQQAAPSYSPAPSSRVSPAPSSSPAPSRDNGNSNGGNQGGGRSGGGRR